MKYTKRFLAFSLTLVMLFSAFPLGALAGATSPTLPMCTEHTGGTATCQAMAQCANCGVSYGSLGEHTYSNLSDTACDLCGFIREVSESPTICLKHIYDNDCDEACNNCGRTRQVAGHTGGTATCEKQAVCTSCGASYGDLLEHTYDDDKDLTCNACGFTRANPDDYETPGICFQHKFDDCLDDTCNVCGATRQVTGHTGGTATCAKQAECSVCGALYGETAAHSYSFDCDADCNECGYVRDAADHIYQNDCDTDCNTCGATRTPSDHVYTDQYDADCNVCGSVRQVPQRPEGDVLLGDANVDGKVNNKDLVMIQRFINSWGNEINETAADYNKDGKINNKDLVMIQRFINGWFDTPEQPGGGESGGGESGGVIGGDSGVSGEIIGGGTDLWN